jgi:hypothetical protein
MATAMGTGTAPGSDFRVRNAAPGFGWARRFLLSTRICTPMEMGTPRARVGRVRGVCSWF